MRPCLLNCGDQRHTSAEQPAVLRSCTALPRAILVGKVDSFPEWRMAGPPEHVEPARAWYRQVFLLQPYERRRGCAVIPGELQAKPVRFVFLVPAECQERGADEK